MVSGGFDPVHIGHIRMIQDAARWGTVIVAINSDDWLMRKKGYVFMPWKQRAEIIGNIKGVTVVTNANGGDRKKENTPEMNLCNDMGIQMLWNVGGADKPQSSSWLVNKAMEQLNGTTK